MKGLLKNIIPVIVAALLFACHDKDDETEPDDGNEVLPYTTTDALKYFQDAFVVTDSLGGFVNYSLGEPLYANDTKHLYIGVEDIDEALMYFESSIAPTIQKTVSVSYNYTYTLTDKDGKGVGTVSFAPSVESGSVAEITTDIAGLKYFDRVTFLNNAAWPHNVSKGAHHKGDTIHYDLSWKNITAPIYKETAFVCVREKANGVNPLYVAITQVKCPTQPVFLKLMKSRYCPEEAHADMVVKIIKNDFDFFRKCFAFAGEGPLEHDDYWYNNTTQSSAFDLKYGAINLATGEKTIWKYNPPYLIPKKYMLLRIDFLDD